MWLSMGPAMAPTGRCGAASFCSAIIAASSAWRIWNTPRCRAAIVRQSRAGGWRLLSAGGSGPDYRSLDLPCWRAAPEATFQVIDRLIDRPGFARRAAGGCSMRCRRSAGSALESNYEGSRPCCSKRRLMRRAMAHTSLGCKQMPCPGRSKHGDCGADRARDRGGASPGVVARRFHDSVAGMIEKVCVAIREARRRQSRMPERRDFSEPDAAAGDGGAAAQTPALKCFLHAKVPPNDGGVSLGQAVIAATWLERN